MSWPLDAYVGQHVAAIKDCYWETHKSLVKGKIYTIMKIEIPSFTNDVYFVLDDVPFELRTRYDLVRPLDESRLDVFRGILKNADNSDLVRNEALDSVS